MGVDYSANFGIGFKLNHVKGGDNGAMCEYMEDLPKQKDFEYEWFEVGNCYDDKPNDFYICVKDPLDRGSYGLEAKKGQLEQFLEDNNVEYIEEFNIFGGLCID